MVFAPSAGNRDSVLSLGSIAHLQYYFARTGLLDGKGGQLARDRKKERSISEEAPRKLQSLHPPTIVEDSNSVVDDSTDASVADEDTSAEWEDRTMLPPTVSTYSHRTEFVPPPPDSESLRQDLKKALADAEKALGEAEEQLPRPLERSRTDQTFLSPEDLHSETQYSPNTGWHQLQGIHILDVVTLAIQKAKLYYTAHENSHILYSIKSERQIREELLLVLDILKRLAGRNFAGGIRPDEVASIKHWVQGIEDFIDKEQIMEEGEKEKRVKWKWIDGSWDGKERTREFLFMKTFLPNTEVPDWEPLGEGSSDPSPFLRALQDGRTLVILHNSVLKNSKRQFGEIKTFHEDTAKPYRCAENLRFWLKAAEIRWETKLKLDVMSVVYGRTEAWIEFENAILQWCKAAREELTKEWQFGYDRGQTQNPNIVYEEILAVD